jgi:hypothetical protein
MEIDVEKELRLGGRRFATSPARESLDTFTTILVHHQLLLVWTLQGPIARWGRKRNGDIPVLDFQSRDGAEQNGDGSR